VNDRPELRRPQEPQPLETANPATERKPTPDRRELPAPTKKEERDTAQTSTEKQRPANALAAFTTNLWRVKGGGYLLFHSTWHDRTATSAALDRRDRIEQPACGN
jgi:hypothetical protein